MNTTTKAKGKGETLRLWAFALLVLLAGGLFTLGMGTAVAAPAAGTVIGNQATASYTDATNTGRIATSNLVQTTVSQVNSFTLTANGARTGAPGQTVYYPHTITNTGNGADTYNLTAATSGNFGPNTTGSQPHSGLAYYIDANGDGLPDNATPISTTGPIAAGGIFRFVVAGTVPAGAVNGDTATIGVAATGTAAPLAAGQANTDTTTVAASVVTVTKALSTTSGPAGVTLTVTLSYTNSGTVAATNLTLTDNVGTGGFTYVNTSGRWSVSGATQLTEATGPGDPAGIDYSVTGSTVTAIVASVPAGFSGNVTFQVQVPSGRAPGFMPNTATFSTATQTPASNTNTASYQVLQTASVVANGSTTSSLNFPSGLSAEPVSVGSAAAGATIPFNNVIWNKGNAADTFVISMAGQAGWPAGSTFTLYQSDGVTSLISNTTPSIPAYAGASCGAGFFTDAVNGACGYVVVLKVQLPANATGGPYTITKTARSSFDNTKSDTVDDTLGSVTPNTVDITNNAASGQAGALGTGAGTATVLVTNSVTPSTSGTTAVTPFKVYVTNTGAVTDNFNLSVTSVVPAGWSVQFFADNSGAPADCSTLGASLTSTGALATAASRLVCAVVTVPSTVSGNAAPGTTNFTFRAQSATNAAVADTLVDAVTVNTVNNVTLTPPNTQQTFPGGSVTYTHVLTNNGNVTETITWNANTDSRSGSGWTSATYVDANGNGSFDTGTDDVAAQLVPGGANATFTLAPGVTRAVFVRVFAPGSATAADPANVTTVTAKYNGGALSTSVTDTTSVTDGLVLNKTQGTVNCANGAQVLAQTAGSLPAQPPGTCIKYQVTGQNTTAANITSVVINDNVPGSTAVLTTACATSTTVGTTNVAAGTSGFTGTVTATVGTLTPSQSAVLTFCVQIAP